MSGFSAEWLALREPADIAARSEGVTHLVVAALAGRVPVRAVDLGSGSGSNVRYLSPRLGAGQEWILVDNDPVLLAVAERSLDRSVRTRVQDLGSLDTGLFDGVDLVTASALLDLVSGDWLRQLVERCRAAGANVLFALNYDGRMACTPADEDDELVRDLVNRHQVGDKGFGPALGPDAGARAESWLVAAGYRVCRERSDWVLGAAQTELQRQLIDGWARAAAEIAPKQAERLEAWRRRRLVHVDEGASALVVGHDDVGGVR